MAEEVARSWEKVTEEALAPDEEFQREVETGLRRKRVDREVRRLLALEDGREGSESWQPPAAQSGKEFLATPDPDLTYRVDELWPTGGNVVLVAKAKAGKTTMVLNLIRSLLTEARFLGRFEVLPVEGKVCLIDLELSEPTIRRWMRDLNLDHDQLLVMPYRGKGSWLAECVTNPAHRALFAAWLKENGVEVLIIDPLAALLSGAGVEENNNSEVGRLLRNGLAALQEEAGISELMIVHHAGYGADRARGASSLVDWPDATWTYSLTKKTNGEDDEMDADDPTTPRFLSAMGRDVALPRTHVEYDPETRRLRIDDDSGEYELRKRQEREQLKDAEVYRVLVEVLHGVAGSSKKWEDAVGGNAAAFRRARDRLVERGAVIKSQGETRNSFKFTAVPHDDEDQISPDDSRPPGLKLVRDDPDDGRTT